MSTTSNTIMPASSSSPPQTFMLRGRTPPPRPLEATRTSMQKLHSLQENIYTFISIRRYYFIALLIVFLSLIARFLPQLLFPEDHFDLFCATQSRQLSPLEHAPSILKQTDEIPGFVHKFSRVKPDPLKPPPSTWTGKFFAFIEEQRLMQSLKSHLDAGFKRTNIKIGGDIMEKLSFGEVLGDTTYHMLDKGATRCAATSYASIVYFCGAAAGKVAHDPVFASFVRETGTSKLRKKIAAAQTWYGTGTLTESAQAIFEIYIDDEDDEFVGHVFTFHVLPDSRIQIYQSFITTTTLKEHLLRIPPLDAKALDIFLTNLETLEFGGPMIPTTSQLPQPLYVWTKSLDDAYAANFANEKLSESPHNKKTTHGKITISSYTACVIAPFNDTTIETEMRHTQARDFLLLSVTKYLTSSMHDKEMATRASVERPICSVPHVSLTEKKDPLADLNINLSMKKEDEEEFSDDNVEESTKQKVGQKVGLSAAEKVSAEKVEKMIKAMQQ
jgi:hypothetical protein